MMSTPSSTDVYQSPEQTESETSQPRPEGVVVPRPGRSSAPVSASRGSIRRGRAAVALGSLAALVLGIVTGILAPLTAISWTLPVFLVVLGLGGLACLRYLAMTERAQQMRGQTSSVAQDEPSAPADDIRALSTESPANQGRSGTTSAAPTAVFDNQPKKVEDPQASSVPQASRSEEVPVAATAASSEVPVIEEPGLDLEVLREQARRVAAGKPVSFTPATSTWEPVAVPRPTYVDAPEAKRRAPEPLDVPEQPRSTSSTLSEAASKGLDLDDVLSRRRA